MGVDTSIQFIINQIPDPSTRAAVQKLVEWMIAELAKKADE